jgi:ubiquinone/menaquinone biosynthesis C-methylase UbiE
VGTLQGVSLLPDYSRQAQGYDRTRAASPAVSAHLRAALAGAPGPRLADIGGGTGNYADALREEGFEPLVIDRSPEMLARAEAKGLPTLLADAQRLPCPDGCFDASMLVSMLHHVEDRAAAVGEAVRVLRRGGRLAIMLFTREDIDDLWLLDYFPSTRGWMDATHPCLGEVLAMLPGARREAIVLTDLRDASLAALASHPRMLLQASWRSQTSYFERLAAENAAELAAGLERLAGEVAAGNAPSRPGRASIVAWKRP